MAKNIEKEIIVTNHAIDRIRERAGVNKRGCQRLAEKAYDTGIILSETNGNLHRYVMWMTKKSFSNAEIKLHGDKAFVFSVYKKKAILVTVIQIPTRLRNQTISTKKRKELNLGIA